MQSAIDRSNPALARKLRDFNQNTMVPFRHASMERVKRELRNVKVHQIEDRTHMASVVQKPDALADIVSEFLLPNPAR